MTWTLEGKSLALPEAKAKSAAALQLGLRGVEVEV